MDIQHIRSETPGVAHKKHLNNAGAALPPKIVLDTLLAGFQEEAEIGGYEFMLKYNAVTEGFYTAVAKLLNTQPRNIAYTTNATDSYNRALSSIAFERGDIILTTDDDYVANQLAFIQLRQRLGVETIHANCLPTGGVDVENVAFLIKKYRPKLVAVTHVPTNSGLVQDVSTIGKLCREADILYLVDACQSVGQMEVDAEAMGCDFLTATYRKWLRGPRGTGLLYVSDRVLESDMAPHFIDLRGSEWLEKNKYQLVPDAKRFEIWERSYPLLFAAKAATEYALEIGIENIEKRVTELANYTRQGLESIAGVQVLDRGQQRCGIVTAHLAGVDPNALVTAFAKRDINVSAARRVNALIDFDKKQVNWALRMSPHYYNTKEEIDSALEVLRE